MTRVLVCGGREYDEWECFANTMFEFFHPRVTGKELVVIHGDAKGADFMARIWAIDNKVKELRFTSDWKTHGKKAGSLRNQLMLEEGMPDIVLAFPGGVGTADMVRRAKRAGVEVWEVGGK